MILHVARRPSPRPARREEWLGGVGVGRKEFLMRLSTQGRRATYRCGDGALVHASLSTTLLRRPSHANGDSQHASRACLTRLAQKFFAARRILSWMIPLDCPLVQTAPLSLFRSFRDAVTRARYPRGQPRRVAR